MVVGVLGGTGNAGREAAAELDRRGHRTVVLSRTASGIGEHRRVDVVSGEGLGESMAGLDALVEVLNGSASVLVEGVNRALAAARAAGVAQVVSLSVLGADRVPFGYYRTKVAQQAAVEAGGLPWSVLQACQFHSLLDSVFAAAARRGVLPMLRVPLQPVDVREVGVRLADLVEMGPIGVSRLAGPRAERLDRLAQAWAHARGVRRLLPLPVPVVGPALQAVRAGAFADPVAPRGRVTFEAWLAEAR